MDQQIIKARLLVEFYLIELRGTTGITVVKAPKERPPSFPETREHIAYMLHEIPEMLDTLEAEYSQELWGKVNRRLGFLQGVFWMRGEYTLEEIETHVATPWL